MYLYISNTIDLRNLRRRKIVDEFFASWLLYLKYITTILTIILGDRLHQNWGAIKEGLGIEPRTPVYYPSYPGLKGLHKQITLCGRYSEYRRNRKNQVISLYIVLSFQLMRNRITS